MRLIFIGKNIKMKIVTNMNKLLSSILLVIVLISNSTYAETAKSSKKNKSTDTNQTMTDDEFMKQFTALDKQEKDSEKKLEKTIKLRKSVDELVNTLNIKNWQYYH